MRLLCLRECSADPDWTPNFGSITSLAWLLLCQRWEAGGSSLHQQRWQHKRHPAKAAVTSVSTQVFLCYYRQHICYKIKQTQVSLFLENPLILPTGRGSTNTEQTVLNLTCKYYPGCVWQCHTGCLSPSWAGHSTGHCPPELPARGAWDRRAGSGWGRSQRGSWRSIASALPC